MEDPVRRTYKRLLALTFMATSSLHILLEVVFQVITELQLGATHSRGLYYHPPDTAAQFTSQASCVTMQVWSFGQL